METSSSTTLRTSFGRPSTRLGEDILRVLIYFDIFHYPLTSEEIYRFLPSNSTSPAEILSLCTTGALRNIVTERQGHFFLAEGNGSGELVPARMENERRARRYLSVARFLTRIMRRFPFVRAVLVSGELSKGVATRRGDIDYVVITAENRLWIARTMLILFKKTVLLNSKRFFCLNHFITESFLHVTTRNIYSALEIATLKPLYNVPLCSAYMETNSWISRFFPNLVHDSLPNHEHRSPSYVQRFFEIPFRGSLGDRLDVWLMEFWKKIWQHRYAGLPKEKREMLFRSERSISTAYAGDFLSRVLAEYRTRLGRFGLDAGSVEE